jgi:hypothetical protein
MSWLFSQVLVEAFSEAICSDGEQSAPLSGNPIPQAFCAPDKMKAFSRVSRFGMTFAPLTEDRGEELLTWFLGAFPAKTFPQPEKEQGSTESEAECGPKWHGSFTKYDLNSCLWRTHQCSLLGDLEPFLETWPRWGLMQSGECWEQQTLAHRTSETESGLLEKWPTPTVMDSITRSKESWEKAQFRPRQGKNLIKLGDIQFWPTPTASVGGPQMMGDKLRLSGAKGSNNLAGAVKAWPTPTDHNAKEGAFPAEYNRKTPTLAAEAGGALNPNWVEWLMGWPLGWTDLKPLETDRFQKWLDEHSNN